VTLSDRVKIALVLVAGVVLPGLANHFLVRAGYDEVGVAVWVLGYLGAMLLVWYVWLRPIEITGP
jgi:hypothetical protein